MAATRLDLPTGTVTFFRTDVEGSMRHARTLGSRWDELNARQLATIRRAVADAGGVTVRTEGDAVFAAFPEALGAVRAAIATQMAIRDAAWPAEAPLRVRVGLHAGEAHLAGDDYGGFDVNRAARIAGVAHGGQIILSDPVRALVAADMPPGVGLRDLGAHPLKDVPQPERLFQLEVQGLEQDFPPPRTAAPAPGNLPLRLTSFIGRDAELAELRRLLADARLVTIWGPGGIGKTSVAIEVARHAAADYPDGVWFVALESTADPAQVPAAIARTLGLYDGPGRPAAEGVARFLADRTTLLVLDNFEHLLDAAPEIPPLLRAAPGLGPSSPAGHRCGSPASRHIQSARSPGAVPTAQPCDCSRSVPGARCRAGLPVPTCPPWRRSAGCSMVCRWASSWLRLGPVLCPSP